MAIGNMVGASVRRHEDPKLVSGAGTYVDDIKLPGMLYVGIAHSPYAHARITKVDTSALDGVKGRGRQDHGRGHSQAPALAPPNHLGYPARYQDARPLGDGDRRRTLRRRACGRSSG